MRQSLRTLPFVLPLIAFLILGPLGVCASPEQVPLLVRVGIVSYQDFEKTFEEYEKYFLDLAQPKANERNVLYQLAIGTYNDVLDWYNRDLIDIGIFAPALVADLLASSESENQLQEFYIASHVNEPATNPPSFEYKAKCVVSERSEIKSIADIQDRARDGRISFLFVNPLSTSGHILPRYLLQKELKIKNFGENRNETEKQNSIIWTQSHTNSLKILKEENSNPDFEGNKKAAVAFVFGELEQGTRQIEFPALDRVSIPQEIVLMNKRCKDKREIEKALINRGSTMHFANHPNWLEKFKEVRQWLQDVNVTARSDESRSVTLEFIGESLRKFEMRHGKPSRLALVLSGGGAKCAYQLGGIEALEGELARELNDEQICAGEKKVDIGLVVGTSGGAINALCAALGYTRPGNGLDDLKEVWMNFDQRDFLRPYSLVGLALGACVASLQAALSLFAILLVSGRMKTLHKWSAMAVMLVGVADLLMYWQAFNPPWRILGPIGKSHSWHHLWLLFSLNLEVSGICLLVMGVIMMITARSRFMNAESFKSFRRLYTSSFFIGLVTVLLIASYFEPTLSDWSGLEDKMAKELTQLYNKHSNEGEAINLDRMAKEQLAELSRQIISNQKLERDLIITGSRLATGAPQLSALTSSPYPDDLYFFFDHKPSAPEPACPFTAGHKPAKDLKPNRTPGVIGDQRVSVLDPPIPPGDKRFVSFSERPSILLDVVIGSSSIYPVFPSRKLEDLGLSIIDGGFAHNSPIEAAVKWGATHIVLIEASPMQQPSGSDRLYLNAIDAFNHLYLQAQLLDAHSRGKVEIFTLRPTLSRPPDPPNLCVFDFSDILIVEAISKGNSDAMAETQPRFRRESGQPYFRGIGVSYAE